MKKTLIAVAVVIMFVMVVGPVYSQEYKLLPQREAFYGPIETTHWDKAKAYNGYVMFNRPYGSGNYVLIDMAGNVCHTWTKGGLYLLENGNILGTYTVERDPRGWMNYATSGFREIDWDSNVVYEVPPDPSRPLPKYSTAHHDYRIIWNKELGENTIISIANMMVSQEEAVALGADPRFDYSDSYCGGLMEHDMNGNLVWEWWWIDHTVQDRDPGLPNYGEIVEHPEKIDINWPTDEDRHVGPHFPNRIHQPGRGWRRICALLFHRYARIQEPH